MKQAGFSPILVVVLIAVAIGGYFIFQKQTTQLSPGEVSTLTSGITGIVELGPIQLGYCRNNEPCTKPYQATIIVKTADGSKEITKFTSDANGKFSVKLAPGTYLLEPISKSILPQGKPQTVKVESNKFTEVIIRYNTGIR